MTVLQIIVPVVPRLIANLAECLQSIKDNTPVDHVVHVVVGGAHIEDKIGEAVGIARLVYDRFGIIMTAVDPKHGYNAMVHGVLQNSDFQYSAVIPATHSISDKEWFGKMQLPLIRAPGCGMTVAPDDLPPTTNVSYPASWKEPIKSKFFVLSRAVIGAIETVQFDWDGVDIANSIRDHLRAMATNCWIVPSCRVLQRESWE